jgi:hypothetical protein
LIDRDGDCLDVLMTPTFARRSVTQFSKRLDRLSAFSSYHCNDCAITSSDPPSTRPFVGTPLFLETVTLVAKALDLRQHPQQQKLSRRCPDPGAG